MNKLLYVAHRGSKQGLGVENTARAYMDGVNAGYNALETDIRVTKDGVYIILHDPTLERLTFHSKKQYLLDVNNENYETIKDIELSQMYRDNLRSGDSICLVDTYLDICQKHHMIPVIELKWTNGIYSSNDDENNHDYHNIDELIRKIYAHKLENVAYVMTSMRGCLQYVRDHYPSMNLQWLCNKTVKEYLPWCAKNHINIDCEYSYCDEEVVNFAHENNLIVNIWTLNDESLEQKYIDMGVDMITTDILKPKKEQ